MHTYTAEFRIWSEKEDLDLGVISDDLGFAPTNTRKRGEARSRSSRFAESMWGYEVCAGKEWDELEDALESLLHILMPLKSKIRGYRSKYDVVLWCGHFTSSFGGGPTFSAELLQKLGDLGIPLQLETYYSSEENAPSQKSASHAPEPTIGLSYDPASQVTQSQKMYRESFLAFNDKAEPSFHLESRPVGQCCS